MPICPRCRKQYPPEASRCGECDVALVPTRPPEGAREPEARWQETVVVLNAASEMALLPAKSLLEENLIPAIIEEEASFTLWGGLLDHVLSRTGPTLRVARRDAEKASKVLCENNIRCEVAFDAVDRLVNHVISPAVEGKTHETTRIFDILSHQTKDFRREAFARVLKLTGGPGFLVGLLVLAVKGGVGEADVARDVAAALSIEHGGVASSALADAVLESSDPAARRRLASALAHFPFPRAAASLVKLLEDPDARVRDEAIDALYFLSEGETHGFDPDAPESDRAEPVAKWREWAESLGGRAEGARRE